MVSELIEIGKVSSRGQIAIPSGIRNQLNLQEGNKILFILEDDTILMKKVTSKTFAQITEPFRKAKKKIRESEVPKLVHKIRKKK